MFFISKLRLAITDKNANESLGFIMHFMREAILYYHTHMPKNRAL